MIEEFTSLCLNFPTRAMFSFGFFGQVRCEFGYIMFNKNYELTRFRLRCRNIHSVSISAFFRSSNMCTFCKKSVVNQDASPTYNTNKTRGRAQLGLWLKYRKFQHMNQLLTVPRMRDVSFVLAPRIALT
jgi:hypothetical protein